MELNWDRLQAFFMTVTPEMARAWLNTHNNKNRRIKQQALEQYVRDHVGNRWIQNGDTISFDRLGQLVNGQHRLATIAASGKPMQCLIVTGLDPKCRPTVDTQAIRTLANAFEMDDNERFLGSGSAGVNTAAGMWIRIKLGIANSKNKASRPELIEFAERYPDGGMFALEQFGKYPRVRSVTVAPAMAAVARAFYHAHDHLRLARFVEVLCTGMQRHPDDRTIIVLRESLIRSKEKNSNAQTIIYGKTARTIIAYMRGEQISKIYVPSEEPFPLPSDQRTDRGSDSEGGQAATRKPNRIPPNGGQLNL